MNKYNVFLKLATSLCVLGLLSFVELRADEEDHTPLEETMEQTSDALKSLRKMDKDDWAAGAKAARTAADGVRKGMEFIPVLIKDMKDGKEKTMA